MDYGGKGTMHENEALDDVAAAMDKAFGIPDADVTIFVAGAVYVYPDDTMNCQLLLKGQNDITGPIVMRYIRDFINEQYPE